MAILNIFFLVKIFKNVSNLMLFFNRHNRSLLIHLAKREFISRYKGSFGSILWPLVQPLFLLFIYTLAFGVILKGRWSFAGDTAEYALLLFAGLIIFNVFSDVLTKSTTVITNNPNFVKKVVFPLEIMPLVIIVTALIHAVFATCVWIVVYIILIGPLKLSIIFFPLILIIMMPLLFGIGWIFSATGVMVRNIGQFVNIINHSVLFLTPIFYSVEAAPPLIQKFLLINPLTFIIEQYRLILFYGQFPALKGLAVYFLLASFFAWVSYNLFKYLRPSFADIV